MAVTDRSDTRTVWVTNHPVDVLHTDPDCRGLNKTDTVRETKRNRYPNTRICHYCQGTADMTGPRNEDRPIPPEEGHTPRRNLPETDECPWPGCGGDVKWVNNGGTYVRRCYRCNRHPDAVPEDTPAWQIV